EAQTAVRQRVVKMLASMDMQPPQVQIQALVMQVPAGFLADIGMTDDQPDSPVLTLTPREMSMFNAQIREAKKRESLDIPSRPQLQAMDNQTGFGQVGQNFPYTTTQRAKGTDEVTEVIAYEPVGLSMRVTPRINPDGKVLLRVEPTFTTVSPTPVNL